MEGLGEKFFSQPFKLYLSLKPLAGGEAEPDPHGREINSFQVQVTLETTRKENALDIVPGIRKV